MATGFLTLIIVLSKQNTLHLERTGRNTRGPHEDVGGAGQAHVKSSTAPSMWTGRAGQADAPDVSSDDKDRPPAPAM
jgi:hypothetical protein